MDTPNPWKRFDDKLAALVSLVLTAAFLLVPELTFQNCMNQTFPG
jgi:hypothetical protein